MMEVDELEPLGNSEYKSKIDQSVTEPIEEQPKILSDVDDDDDGQICRKKKSRKILNSSDEDDKQPTHQLISRSLIDSDLDVDNNRKETPPNVSYSLGNDGKVSTSSKPLKFSSLIDTDSDDGENEMESKGNESLDKTKQPKKKVYTKKRQKERKKIHKVSDDSSEDESTKSNQKRNSATSSSNDSSSGNDSGDMDPIPTVPREMPAKRLSAKEAMEQMKQIQSDSQRRAREARVNIPYHQPKSFTLKEFMSRRKVKDPKSIEILPIGRSAAASIKMTHEELVQYSKMLDERATEAAEFFKNTETAEISKKSEDELDEDDYDYVVDGKTNDSKRTEENLLTDGKQDLLEIVENIETSEIIDLKEKEPCPNVIDKDLTPSVLDAIPKESNSIEIDYDLGEKECFHPNIYRSIPDDVRDVVPCLKGDNKSMIDLEDGNILPSIDIGPDLLFKRYLMHVTKRESQNEAAIGILDTSNGVIQLDKIVVTLDPSDPLVPVKEPKPGAPLLKLKADLQKKITERRRLDIIQRKSEIIKNIEDKSEDSDETNEYEDDEPEIVDEKEDEVNGKEMIIDDNEDLIDGSAIEDDQDEEDEGEESENGEDEVEYSDDEENEAKSPSITEDSKNNSYQKPSRIIKTFDDSEDESNEKSATTISDKNFGLSTAPSQTVTAELYSQPTDDDVTPSQLMDLCSGKFITQSDMNPTFNQNEIDEEEKAELPDFESSDDENVNQIDKTKTKRRTKIVNLSDDDSDEQDDEDEVEEEIPTTEVDYDSEENEIIKEARGYFENEAELSESEWGSADEDEQDLDKLDMELGDEDEFDREKLQSQLERIHMRQVLDQDAREVRIIKEMFVEDEENEDGAAGRERQFRWKNVDHTISDDVNRTVDPENPNESDDENEQMWRKMRYEREMLLKEHPNETLKVPAIVETETTTMISDTKKFSIFRKVVDVRDDIQTKKQSPFLILNAEQQSLARHSFLKRNQIILNKIAASTAPNSDTDGTTTAGVGGKFVFASLDSRKELAIDNKELASKRRLDDGNTAVEQQQKKMKTNRSVLLKSKKRLIDLLA